MTLRQQLKSSRRSHKSWLYSIVFTSKLSVAAVLFLLLSFCIQPFHQAMAAEDGVVEAEEQPAGEVAEQVEEVATEPEQQTSTDVDLEIPSENEVSSTEEAVLDMAENEEVTETTSIENNETPTDTATSTDTDGTDSTENIDNTDTTTDADTASTSTSDSETEQSDGTSNSSNQSTSSDSAVDGETEQAVEETVTEDVNEIKTLVTDENFYQFSKKACVPVGDGTYHCTSKESSIYDASSAVYSDRGASGNMEIFLRTSRGTVEQITDNNFDDTAPHYDAESKQIVWQRLVNGRFQVVVYDISSGEEKQLTFSKTNNMEPKVSAAGIVWQAWDNNDWEIMYFDGEYAEQITDNILQDVTPVIQDGYIVWSIIGGEEQEAKVYSLDSGEILTISGYEGGTIANPRFVLVYDTKFENGDVVTQGFDPETGLSQPIAAQPAQDPVDLPHNDPTGEIRALIQKSSDDEDLGIDQTNPDGNNGTSTTLDLGGAKVSATSSTLDLSNPSSVDIIFDATSVSTNNKLELNSYDLVITSSSSDE